MSISFSLVSEDSNARLGKIITKRGIINTPSYNQVNLPIYKKSISRWKNYRENFSDINSNLEKWINKFKYN